MPKMKQDILRKVMQIENLPTLPEVMVRLTQVLESDSSSADEVTEVLECDPAIASRTLRLANSAFYGARFKVETIRRAVVTVGFEAVSQLALATVTLNTLGMRKQKALAAEDFWLHALGAAKAAQLLGEVSPAAEDPAVCFTGGLLHDVGKYVLALALGDDYCPIVAAAEEEAVALRVVETRELGTTHATVGAWLMKQWSLPPLVVGAIEHQYSPAQWNGPKKAEVAAVSLCSDLAREAGIGSAADCQPTQYAPSRLRTLGIDDATLGAVKERLAGMRAEARAALNLLREDNEPND